MEKSYKMQQIEYAFDDYFCKKTATQIKILGMPLKDLILPQPI